ncbi:unnamed protein product, partial [marine sediment metagenome]
VDSLIRYEEWISSNYIFEETILIDTGYPFYISGFAELYRGLSRYVSDDYLIKYNQILSYLIEIQNNWMWVGDYGYHPHYNSFFAQNFLDAYLYTKNQTYLDAFTSTVEAFRNFYDGEKIYISENSNLYAFTMISTALSMNLINSTYVSLGLNLVNYSLKFFNESTFEWFNPLNPKYSEGYDGRAAYYQLLSLLWIMMHNKEIKVAFPQLHSNLTSIVNSSIPIVEKYLLDAGTFYYLPDVVDYTESAGATVYGFTLFDKYFNTSHADAINNGLHTIIERQRDDGAYYKTNDSEVV